MDPALKKALDEGMPVRVRPVAKGAGLSPNTIYSAVARGEVESVRVGKSILIPARVARRLLGLDEKVAA